MARIQLAGNRVWPRALGQQGFSLCLTSRSKSSFSLLENIRKLQKLLFCVSFNCDKTYIIEKPSRDLFKVCSSVARSTFAALCHHHLYRLPEPRTTLKGTPYSSFPLPQLLTTSDQPSVSIGGPVLGISCEGIVRYVSLCVPGARVGTFGSFSWLRTFHRVNIRPSACPCTC